MKLETKTVKLVPFLNYFFFYRFLKIAIIEYFKEFKSKML